MTTEPSPIAGLDIDLRHLRCFLAIAEEGNVTRAGERLHLSQPALSRALAQLEGRLGVQLVSRSTHHLELTVAGRRFQLEAAAAVRAFDQAISAAVTGVAPLRLGHAWSTATHTAAIVREWNSVYPDRALQVQRSEERRAGLSRGDVDLALIHGPVNDRSLRTALIDEEGRVAALPIRHRLAQAAEVSLRDLAGEALVVSSLIGTTSLDLWPDPPRPTIAADTPSLDDWLIAIAAGAGVGLSAASTAVLHAHPDVRFVPVRDAAPIPLVIAWPAKGAHPYAKALVSVATRATRHLRGRP